MRHLENICQLPNDGRGMLPADRLKTLRQCLDGYKEKIYVLHIKKHRKLGTLEKDPDAVYQEIKSRHMKFVETAMEREMRVTAMWDNLWMGSKSALEFESAFEEAVMELELVGLSKNQRELLLGYLQKVGPKRASAIQKDARPWAGPGGETQVRRVVSWEEAHRVLNELEGLEAGGRALAGQHSYGGTASGQYGVGGGGSGGKSDAPCWEKWRLADAPGRIAALTMTIK